MKRLLLSSLLCIALSVSFASQSQDPKALLQQANEYRTKMLSDARTAGTQVNFDEVTAKYKAKVAELVKDVDISKIEASKAYDWAALYQAGGMDKEACDLAKKYLDTKPSDRDRYLAMSLMARSCNTLGEADMLAMTLNDMPIPDAMASTSVVSMTTNLYVDTIFEKKGLDAALATLDAIEKKVILEDPKEYAKRMLPARQRAQANATNKRTDEEILAADEKLAAQNNEIATLTIDQKRAELYLDAGKKKEAIETLGNAIKEIRADHPGLRTPKMKLRQMSMVGSGAPELKFVKGINGATWPGIEGLKGKVVILDFFAHWCGPCINSFPDMKAMYADLKDKGLEIYHVTRYYGYFGQERGISEESEFEKMTGFVKQHELPWPVIYADPSFGEAYGIYGIPHATVVDKNGIVHKVKVGYSKESFALFRKEIEALLGAN